MDPVPDMGNFGEYVKTHTRRRDSGDDLSGLALSERYYREYCAPMLAHRFPELVRRIAAGLVGEGSECFGQVKAESIETMSAMIISELQKQGLSESDSDFLLEHGRSIQNGIRDASIRAVDLSLG